MRFYVMSFLVALYGNIHLVCQSTPGSSQSDDHDLVLNDGESLEINTTDGSITKNNGTVEQCYPHCEISDNVANLTFSGQITFYSGSSVKVFGKNALRIKSLNKNILVQTDINMTCNETLFNSTCLGGYTQSLIRTDIGGQGGNIFPLYLGLGEGRPVPKGWNLHLSSCIPGSSHGGSGSCGQGVFKSCPIASYGTNSISPLLGGSAGSCVNGTGRVAGGGAIELIAEKGNITIGASIIARAQQAFGGGKLCSGGSGGHIRLKARKVKVSDGGKLIVDGGDSLLSDDPKFGSGGAGGGTGGVIHIIASEVYLAANSSSLKHGQTIEEDCKPQNGYFLFKPNETAAAIKEGNFNQFPPQGSFVWPPGASKTAAPVTSSLSTVPSHLTDALATTTAATMTSSLSTKPSHLTDTLATTTAATMTSSLSTKPSHSTDTLATTTAAPVTSSLSTVPSHLTDTLATKTTKSGLSIEKRAQSLLKQTCDIKSSLLAGDNVNATALSAVLTEHKFLTANVTQKKEILDLCLAMFEEYKIIVSKLGERDLVEVNQKMIRDSFTVATNCLNEKKHKIWRQTRKMPKLVDNLEKVLAAAIQRNVSSIANLTLNTEKLAVQVRQSQDAWDLTLPDYSEINDAAWAGVSDSVFIPKQLFQSKGNYTYVVVLYKDVESGLPLGHSGVRGVEKVSSLFMSCSLIFEKSVVRKLSNPVILNFSSSMTEKRERFCSYWNITESAWASDGVTLEKSESVSERTVCKTDHLTSFAVLMQHKDITISEKDQLALSIITYVGCGISILALAITIIVFLSIESLSTDRHKIHTNLALALLLAQILFLSGINETSSKALCQLIAVFLHYFFLTAFTWMLVEGVHLYLKVVQVFRTENFRMAYYYAFGWCFPAIPVGITAAMKPETYGNDKVCWLSMEHGTVWAFIGPVVAIIAINCFILFMVVKTVVSSASAVKSASHSNDHVKAGVKGLLVLMPILGVSWLLGLFFVDRNTLFFQYAFAICNASQGLLIFLLHCLFNSEVRQAFRRHQEKRALSKESDYSHYNSSFSFSESNSAYANRKERSGSSFEKLKARLSLKLLSGSKVVQVQPLSESHDSDKISLQVKRTFEKNSSKCLAADDHQRALSSLHCPMEEKDRGPPKQTNQVSQHSQQAAVRRKQRP